MRFDVRPILHAPGKRLTFQFSLDLSDVEFAGRHPISRPVEVEGAVSNTADLLELELTARTTLDAVCDRCGKAFLQDKTVPFRCLLAEELQNEDNDEIVLLEDGEVDVGDLARTAFILGMDTKTLCSEDCKGLCPLLLREGDGSPSGGPGKAFREQRERMNKAGGDSVAFERSRRCHNGST